MKVSSSDAQVSSHSTEQMIAGMQMYKHGYISIAAEDDVHILHLDENYVPDICTCDSHETGITDCKYKQAAHVAFVDRRKKLEEEPEPIYYYYDQNRRVYQAGRYDMLTKEEQRNVFCHEFEIYA